MHILKKLAFLLIVQFMVFGTAHAQEHGNADQARSLVEKGLAHIKTVGMEKAFEDFTAKDGKWQEKDLYVFVVKFDGVTVAHGGNKGLIGKNMLGLQDANGQTFIKSMVDAAKTKETSWVDYMWTNPQTKKVEPKSSYVVRIPNYEGFIGVGIYK